MKRIYLYFLAPMMAALSLTSCEEDVVIGGVSEYPTFTATIEDSESRAYDTYWESNDKIGIYCGDIVNISHTHQGDGNFKVTDESKQIVFTADTMVHFYAYYPYSTVATSGNYKGKVSTYASTAINQANQKNFDYLWAEADGSKFSPNVNFKFKHMMSKISFEFIAEDGVDLSAITAYSIAGLYLRGTFNPLSGACETTTTSTGTSSVDMSKVNILNGDLTPSMILFPQVFKAPPLTLSVTAANAGIGTITGTLTFKENKIEPGNNYHFVVKISKTSLSIAKSTILGWNETDLGETWEAW